MNGELAIDVRGLTKRYGARTVVDDVAIQVRRGEICGFLGPNGSGKTTTIRMLCGLLEPDGGEGRCLGLDIRRDASRIKRRVGYMTQRFGLYEDLSIEENLDFVARAYGMPERRRVAPADALVHDVMYRPGEWVPAGAPVVALLPPAAIHVRFFVPQTLLPRVSPGAAVQVRCDGCPAPLAARIRQVATHAEYTPPVIYSNGQRAKLVFMVEARPAPADGARLRPGQPVDVKPAV